jgi:hypothetical protein
MWTSIKVFFSGKLKQILSKLIPWLKTEVAAFVAEYMDVAVDIVTDVGRRSELDNKAKFQLAKEMLLAELIIQGKTYKENRVNALIEMAVGMVKEQAKPEVK